MPWNLKKAQNELADIYLKKKKKTTEYIQIQINKNRDSVKDRQSWIAWQMVNEVRRRKITAKAKLKATCQEERMQLWKQHFENLLGKHPKLHMNQLREVFVNN